MEHLSIANNYWSSLINVLTTLTKFKVRFKTMKVWFVMWTNTVTPVSNFCNLPIILHYDCQSGVKRLVPYFRRIVPYGNTLSFMATSSEMFSMKCTKLCLQKMLLEFGYLKDLVWLVELLLRNLFTFITFGAFIFKLRVCAFFSAVCEIWAVHINLFSFIWRRRC